MIRFLFLIAALLGVAFSGYWFGGAPSLPKQLLTSKREFPVEEEKSFVVIVHSYKQATCCERALHSIFEQDYGLFRVVFFDDGSEDGTFEKVQSFVLENKQEHRVILIQNQERVGPAACLYRAAGTLLNEEIVVFLDAKDWMAHPKTLQRLNGVYQNPDVWLTFSNPILYPSYETPHWTFSGKEIPSHISISFYAALFKQIRFGDLFREGRFISGRDGYLRPMMQMADGRWRTLNEPLFIANQAISRLEVCDASLVSYDPLASFPTLLPKRG